MITDNELIKIISMYKYVHNIYIYIYINYYNYMYHTYIYHVQQIQNNTTYSLIFS